MQNSRPDAEFGDVAWQQAIAPAALPEMDVLMEVTASDLDPGGYSCCFINAASCPGCGGGMARLGSCFSCPSCGYSTCGC